MKILLIEDDENLAASMKFQLEKEGYETDICHDGEEGLYYMKERSHDLVILDRMLPSMDGISEDAYIEKGMLEDLSGVLKDADILSNIRDAYTKEDGSIYTMPVKFGIPMIEGNKDIIAGITGLTTEADAAESQKDSYGKLKFFSDFSVAPSYLIQGTIDNSTPAWMNKDGTLNEDALKEYLEQVNRIWQTQKNAIEETKKAYQMGDGWANSDRSGYTDISGSVTSVFVKVNTVATGGLLSPKGLVYLDSARKVDPDLDYKLLNGQSENCFYISLIWEKHFPYLQRVIRSSEMQ